MDAGNSGGRALQLWLVVCVTVAVQVLATFTTLTLAAVAPDVAAGVGVSAQLIGFQVSLLYLGASLTSTIAGFQLRRWGPVRVSQASLALTACGALLTAVPALPVIAAGSLLIGFGYGMTNPAASQLLINLTPPAKRNFIFSIKQTGVPIGGVLAGLVAPVLSTRLGWQSAPLVAAFACLVLIAFIQPLRAGWDAGHDSGARFREQPFESVAMVWRSASLRWLSAHGFFYAAVQLCLATFTVTLLVSEMNFGLVAAGGVLAVVQMSGVAGRVVWGWVADRTGRGLGVLIVIGAICAGNAVLLTAIDPGWPLIAVYGLFAVFGFNALGWTGIFLVEAVRHVPASQSGAVVGGVGVSTYAGVIFGPATFAIAYTMTGGYGATFGLVAVFAMMGMLCLTRVHRKRG